MADAVSYSTVRMSAREAVPLGTSGWASRVPGLRGKARVLGHTLGTY
jgi:hypothetical protein